MKFNLHDYSNVLSNIGKIIVKFVRCEYAIDKCGHSSVKFKITITYFNYLKIFLGVFIHTLEIT